MNEEGEYIVPENAIGGTIIAAKEGCDRDGYDMVESITIRWKDGRIEETKFEGEDELGEWEIADVTPKHYANVYLYDREYGGPEEGGWWYDTYSPITDSSDWDSPPPKHGHFPTVEEAEKAITALDEWCKIENSTRRSPSSVLSDGHYTTRLEAWPAEFEPKQRPHYC
jgi:hypothetical protein